MKNLFATIFLTLAMLPVNTWALASESTYSAVPSKSGKYFAAYLSDIGTPWEIEISTLNNTVKGTVFVKYAGNTYVLSCPKRDVDAKGEFALYCSGDNFSSGDRFIMRPVKGDLKTAKLWGQGPAGGAIFHFIPYSQKTAYEAFARDTSANSTKVFVEYLEQEQAEKAVQIAKQEEDRQERAAADRLRAAAEKAQLEAVALAKAENARLEAEIGALKEAQRDRLGEAFGKRSQAEREAIQQRLFERGLYQSTVDGSFGTGTRSAIEEYARANNKIDLKSIKGAATVIAELISLQPSTTGAVIVAAKGRAPLDLSKQANAKIYLDDVREFVSLNPKELDPLVLGGSYSPAIQEVQSRTFNKAGSNFLRLVAYTRSSAPFREFLEAKLEKRFEAEEGERTAIANVIVEQVNAMKTRLAANPLAPDAFKLSQLIKKYGKVPQGANAETLKELRYLLEGELKKLGVSVADAPASTSLD